LVSIHVAQESLPLPTVQKSTYWQSPIPTSFSHYRWTASLRAESAPIHVVINAVHKYLSSTQITMTSLQPIQAQCLSYTSCGIVTSHPFSLLSWLYSHLILYIASFLTHTFLLLNSQDTNTTCVHTKA